MSKQSMLVVSFHISCLERVYLFFDATALINDYELNKSPRLVVGFISGLTLATFADASVQAIRQTISMKCNNVIRLFVGQSVVKRM